MNKFLYAQLLNSIKDSITSIAKDFEFKLSGGLMCSILSHTQNVYTIQGVGARKNKNERDQNLNGRSRLNKEQEAGVP